VAAGGPGGALNKYPRSFWARIVQEMREQGGVIRNSVQVRSRWVEQLDPAINPSQFMDFEDEQIRKSIALGKKWAAIEVELYGLASADKPRRPANKIKNRWHGYLKP
jgi:hypothetical protein